MENFLLSPLIGPALLFASITFSNRTTCQRDRCPQSKAKRYHEQKSKLAYLEGVQARASPWEEVNAKLSSAFETVQETDRRMSERL